jgi:predicted glycosyltransferase
MMNVLFDINHPAHVHLFKNAIWELEDRGADVLVTSREKEITTDLLDAYDIDHRPLSAEEGGAVSLVSEWAAREVRLFSAARSFDPDVVVGRLNPPLVHVSKLLGARNVVVMDTEIKSDAIDTVYSLTTDPFIDVYCTPPGFDTPNDDAEHHLIDFQELAYLRPEYFTPDPERLEAEGVDPSERYFVVRFAAWDAFHDVGYQGFSEDARRELVSYLDERGEVYITSEDSLPEEFAEYQLPIPPHLVHHLLYYADLYVGDSGTMSSEAAILGTPAVRTNSMVDDDTESIFFELENEYGLLYSFADERRALQRVRSILDEGGDDDRWRRKREALVADKQDVTGRLLDLVVEAARP